MCSVGTARALSCLELRVCGFGMTLGKSRGLVCLSDSLKLCFESLGASLVGGKQEKDKISSGPLPMSRRMWGGGNLRFGAQGALMRRHSPVCPQNVPAGENLVIQEGLVLPDSSALSKKLHTALESHLY